jgi:phosphatidylinositol 3-kinase
MIEIEVLGSAAGCGLQIAGLFDMRRCAVGGDGERRYAVPLRDLDFTMECGGHSTRIDLGSMVEGRGMATIDELGLSMHFSMTEDALSISSATAAEICDAINGREEYLDSVVCNIHLVLRYAKAEWVERLLGAICFPDVSIYLPVCLVDELRLDLSRESVMRKFWWHRLRSAWDDEMVSFFIDYDKRYNIIEDLERQMAFLGEASMLYKAISGSGSSRKRAREYNLSSILFLKSKMGMLGPTISPVHADTTIHQILMSKIRIYPTSNYPISIPLATNKGIRRVIYKRCDNLALDLFVLENIRYMGTLVGLELIAYGVVSVSGDEGLIEVVEGIDFTREDGELRSYVVRGSGDGRACAASRDELLAEARSSDGARRTALEPGLRENRFIDSLAAHLVVIYVLGIGDRNPGNMLVSRTGHFFQIDFSFILGKDPKFFAHRITVPGFISRYLMEDQLRYARLLSKAAEYFIRIRRSFPRLCLFWAVLLQDGVFGLDLVELTRFTGERLQVEKSEEEAAAFLRGELESCLGSIRSSVVQLINKLGCLLRRL